MIRSMTGFGRATFEIAGRPFEVEIRTVNHRHLDSRIRLPRLLADQESLVKSLVQGGLSRGKVDVNISAGAGPAAGPAPKGGEARGGGGAGHAWLAGCGMWGLRAGARSARAVRGGGLFGGRTGRQSGASGGNARSR